MRKNLSIKTSLSPVYFEKYTDNESIVVVIDILRATSVISTAFHYGVKEIIPVQTLDQALDFKGKKNYIVAAERNALLIDGFDFGNSPFHYMNKDVQDKTLVFTTTNGTKAFAIPNLKAVFPVLNGFDPAIPAAAYAASATGGVISAKTP